MISLCRVADHGQILPSASRSQRRSIGFAPPHGNVRHLLSPKRLIAVGGRHSTRRRPSLPRSGPEQDTLSGVVKPRARPSPVERLRHQEAIKTLDRLQKLIEKYLEKAKYPTNVSSLFDRLQQEQPNKKPAALAHPYSAMVALTHVEKARDFLNRGNVAGAVQSALMAGVCGADVLTRADLAHLRRSAGGRKKAERLASAKRKALEIATVMQTGEEYFSATKMAEIIQNRLCRLGYTDLPTINAMRRWFPRK